MSTATATVMVHRYRALSEPRAVMEADRCEFGCKCLTYEMTVWEEVADVDVFEAEVATYALGLTLALKKVEDWIAKGDDHLAGVNVWTDVAGGSLIACGPGREETVEFISATLHRELTEELPA